MSVVGDRSVDDLAVVTRRLAVEAARLPQAIGSRGGGQDQWVPDQWVPDQWVPDQWVPDQWVPDQWVPDQWVPDQ